MLTSQLVDIGHSAVMLPVAAAIAAFLIAGGSWRLALLWSLMFIAGLGIVAASKIAFLGWKIGIPSIGFQALSGHAFRSAAVIPVLFFVMTRGARATWHAMGITLGIALCAGVGVLLVRFQFHTVSEVIPSLILGSVVSLAYMRGAKTLPAHAMNNRTVAITVVIFLMMYSLKPARISPRLVDVALYLSGRDHPYRWSMQREPWGHRLVCKPSALRH